MTTADSYVGRRTLDVFDPEDVDEDRFALRARQITAATHAYELQLRAYYEPNPAIAARLDGEAGDSQRLATELCAIADGLDNGGGEEE